MAQAQRASATQSIGAVLGTVTVAATAVTSLFTAVGNGASMLNKYVEDASVDQQDASKIHRQVYRSNLVTNAALEQSKLKAEVEAHLNSLGNEARESFNEVHTSLTALFADA